MTAIPGPFDIAEFSWRPANDKVQTASTMFNHLAFADADEEQMEEAAAEERLKNATRPESDHEEADAVRRRRKRTRKKSKAARKASEDIELITTKGGEQIRVPRRTHIRNGGKTIVVPYEELDQDSRDLYDELKEFYEDTDYVEKIVYPYGEEMKDVALRLINCAVTSYAPQKSVKYRIDMDNNVHDVDDESCFDPNTNVVIDLVDEYETKLNRRNKTRFDPCRRHERIKWTLADGTTWITTLGQLNFFRWAISIRLLTWCEQHKADLTAFLKSQDEANLAQKRRARAMNRKPTRKRRRDASAVARSSVAKFTRPLVVSVWTVRHD